MNSKLCECGCGLPAPIATQTNRAQGAIKGQPQRFIQGHNARLLRSTYRVVESGCWEWQGARVVGYGVLKRGDVMYKAHRVLWEEHRGPIPAGMVIDHLCRNKCCVNPDHLEVVTVAENTRRGRSARLTAEAAAAIRQSGERQAVLAARYGVTQTTISRVKRGEAWV